MLDFYIDTLALIGGTTSEFTLSTPIEGLDLPPIRTSEYDKPGESGSVISSAFYGSRLVTLNGWIRAGSCERYDDLRSELATKCAFEKDSTGFPVLQRFTFTTLGGDAYFFDGFVKQATFNRSSKVKAAPFIISVVVPNPQIFSTTQQSSGTIEKASGGGFIFPVNFPIIWGGSTGGSAVLVNNGNAETYPIITITGDFTNFFLYNSTIDRFMQLNYTSSPADVIVIDMLEKTITLNGSSSLLNTKTEDSQWWWLQPGNNNIIFTTGSSADTATVELTWYNAYLGA